MINKQKEKKGKMRIFTIFISFILLFSACSDVNEKHIESFHYESKRAETFTPKILYELNDSFATLFSSDISGDRVVLLDIILNKCFVYENGELICSFGSKGSAPGEFSFVGAGTVKFLNDSLIAVHDPGLFRIQVFDLSGNLLDTKRTVDLAIDFDVLDSFYVFSPMMGKTELQFIDTVNSDEVKTFKCEKEISLTTSSFPTPIRFVEAGKEGIVYVLTTDEYLVNAYTFEDSIKYSIKVDVEPMPFDEELKRQMIEKAPQLEGRISEYKYPVFFMFYDELYNYLWIQVAREDEKEAVYDIFDDDGQYIKRVLINDISFTPIEINQGKIVVFDPDSFRVLLYDIQEVYR